MMKTTIKLLALAFVLFATACSNDDEYDMLNSLWRNVTQNEARIDDLEKWCAQANTNITSLQTIVNVLESNGMVTSITPVMEGGVEIGYTITFSNHDPITIYHGKDGKDGQNGANGQNGTSPIVGVAKYTDGVYYWTLNGEWLLDENGNKLRVSGEDGKDGKDGEDGVDGADGKDGENGKDGADGQNGTNGQNGITPQLKIENDYWWISYDNGNTWTQLGKAKGEDGQTGEKGDKGDKGDTGAAGADGQDGATGAQGEKGDKGDAGDSMFQSVTQDAANVYFTLADGTLITIAKGGGGADDGGYIFTITYMPNDGTGEMVVDTVVYGDSYTIRGYGLYTKDDYYINGWNTEPNGSGVDFAVGRVINGVTRNITLYAQWIFNHDYVDLGLPSGLKWAIRNVGATSPEKYGNIFAWGETEPNTTYNWNSYKWATARWNTGYNEWEVKTLTKYNTSSDYGTVDNKTTLDLEDDAAAVNWGGAWRMPIMDEWRELRDNCTWTRTDDYNGTGVAGQIVTSNINGNSIFLPAKGSLRCGHYWSSSLSTAYPDKAWSVYFEPGKMSWGYESRCNWGFVRPVLRE